MNCYVEIVAFKDDKVIRRMGPYSEREAETIEKGARRNLDHERFFVRTVEEESCEQTGS